VRFLRGAGLMLVVIIAVGCAVVRSDSSHVPVPLGRAVQDLAWLPGGEIYFVTGPDSAQPPLLWRLSEVRGGRPVR
jgi:acyl-CoA reductase-like NAD-dependent aldehyde dehydrogenase